jgi:hypothetical protein
LANALPPILEGLAHLVEKSSIFDRIDRDKDLSGKQLKNFKILRFLLVGSCVFD